MDETDFYPASNRDPEEMFRELQGIIAGIGSAPLRALLEGILSDADVAARYKSRRLQRTFITPSSAD